MLLLVTLAVVHPLPTLIVLRPVQPENIVDISVTLLVSKLDRSRVVKAAQLENTPLIFITFEVLK